MQRARGAAAAQLLPNLISSDGGALQSPAAAGLSFTSIADADPGA